MKTNIKDLFHFSRRDRNGIIVLLILICILIILRFFNVFEYKQQKPDYAEIEKEIECFKDSINQQKNYLGNKYNRQKDILKERKNQHYSRKDYLSSQQANEYNKNKTKNIQLIELNSADSTDLIKIYGIGKVFSKRIVKYRDLLGGYYKIDQLKEVYGINDSIFESFKSSFCIDTNSIRKIEINKIDERTLSLHPYISKYDAKAIIAFREFRNGKINNLNDLNKNNILPDSTFNKISNYLSVK